jgi:uncharacterized SAM-binding protein YcdF (DUF218 family)
MTPVGRRALRGLQFLGVAGLGVFLLGAFVPLANVLNQWMAGPEQLDPAEAIVVLARGGADADGVLTNRSLRRALHAIDLYRRGLAPLLVFSGGPAEASRGEAELRAELARSLGVPAGAILALSSARTTREEAVVLGDVLPRRGIRRILLVADPVDMPRARAAFERVGFVVLPAPTASSRASQPESRLNLLREVAIELAGWIYYRALGRL